MPSRPPDSAVRLVGWDVGGWLGRKQGVAVARLHGGRVHFEGRPTTFRLPTHGVACVTPDDLLREAGAAPLSPGERVLVGIDAPLGFPVGFTRLLAGHDWPAPTGERELENPLAYRLTDRFVAERFGKKPLSASFDRLGNNATVAMAHVRAWTAHGFVPAHQADGDRLLVEVYPALVRERAEVVRAVPPGLDPDGDAFDAALCVLSVAGLLGAEPVGPLLRPEDHVPPSDREGVRAEGWIYGPARR